VVGVDPDAAHHLGCPAARVRLEVGDDFPAAGSARGAFTATGIAAARSLPAFCGAGSLAAAVVLAFAVRRSLQVGQGPFELRLLFTERGDVFLAAGFQMLREPSITRRTPRNGP
jgi:hypothetical protein